MGMEREIFLKKAYKLVEYNCPYVWGGNGEQTRKLTCVKLLSMEEKLENITRIFRYMQKNPPHKYSRIFDCSGLVYYLLKELGILDYDVTADNLFHMWTRKDIRDASAGDLLYCINSDGKAYHVGIYVGNMQVIHAKGRDDGVTISKFSENPWSRCNSPFDD